MSPSTFPPVLPPGRVTFTSPDELIRVVLDSEREEWWMECSPYAPTAEIRQCVLDLVIAFGFELLSEDECEPELRPNGFERIYAVPVTPLAIVHPDDMSLAGGL